MEMVTWHFNPIQATAAQLAPLSPSVSRTSRPPLWRNLQHRVNRARSPSSFSTEFVALDAVGRRRSLAVADSHLELLALVLGLLSSLHSTLRDSCRVVVFWAGGARLRGKRESAETESANPAMRTKDYSGSSELRSPLND